MVDPEMSEYLVQSLTSVRSVKVNIRPIPLEELALRPPQRKQASVCLLLGVGEEREGRGCVVLKSPCYGQLN